MKTKAFILVSLMLLSCNAYPKESETPSTITVFKTTPGVGWQREDIAHARAKDKETPITIDTRSAVTIKSAWTYDNKYYIQISLGFKTSTIRVDYRSYSQLVSGCDPKFIEDSGNGIWKITFRG